MNRLRHLPHVIYFNMLNVSMLALVSVFVGCADMTIGCVMCELIALRLIYVKRRMIRWWNPAYCFLCEDDVLLMFAGQVEVFKQYLLYLPRFDYKYLTL